MGIHFRKFSAKSIVINFENKFLEINKIYKNLKEIFHIGTDIDSLYDLADLVICDFGDGIFDAILEVFWLRKSIPQTSKIILEDVVLKYSSLKLLSVLFAGSPLYVFIHSKTGL